MPLKSNSIGNNYIIGVIIIILIIALIVTLYKQETCEPCKLENDRIKILENKLENSSKWNPGINLKCSIIPGIFLVKTNDPQDNIFHSLKDE